MSEFFESDFVRKGMQDIEDLQVDLQRGFMRFPSLDEEEQQKQLSFRWKLCWRNNNSCIPA